jgi:hypothetical protein
MCLGFCSVFFTTAFLVIIFCEGEQCMDQRAYFVPSVLILFFLANSFPLEYDERFSKSTCNSFVTSLRAFVQLCDQFQSELKVPRGTKAIKTPKVPIYDFYPGVFRPLTLVPIKRVLGVPLANEISDLRAQLQCVNRH